MQLTSLKPPSVYLNEKLGPQFQALGAKLAQHKARVWLLNTGWTGGAYGTGSRMKLGLTRRLVDAVLSGELQNAPTTPDPVFGLAIPDAVEGVPGAVLHPWESWPDRAAYDGPYVSFTDVSSNPKPVNGTIPITVGGHSVAAAKRAGRLGDGFFPGRGTVAELAERGVKVDYVQVWRFAHAEGLSFKKKRPSRRAIEAEGRPAAGAVEEVSGTA